MNTVIELTCWAISMATDGKGPVNFLATRIIAIPTSFLVAMLLFSCVERYFAT